MERPVSLPFRPSPSDEVHERVKGDYAETAPDNTVPGPAFGESEDTPEQYVSPGIVTTTDERADEAAVITEKKQDADATPVVEGDPDAIGERDRADDFKTDADEADEDVAGTPEDEGDDDDFIEDEDEYDEDDITEEEAAALAAEAEVAGPSPDTTTTANTTAAADAPEKPKHPDKGKE